MNFKLYKMENKSKKTVGIPNYFKKIGIILLLLVLAIGIVLKLSGIEFDESTKDIRKILSLDIIILGLTFIAFANDKIEDEMTTHLRLKSMSGTFLFGIILTIINPIGNLVFNEPIAQELNYHQLIMTMLLIQISSYYGLKKAEAK